MPTPNRRPIDKMRALLAALIASAGCGALPSAMGATIVWDMTTSSPSSINAADVSGGAISQFSNNGTTTLIQSSSASTGYSGASGGNNASASPRGGTLNPTTSTAFEFTLTPANGVTLTFTDLLFGNRATGSGPVAWSLRSSQDNYGTDLATATFTNNSTWTLQDAAAFSLTSTTPVTFRLFGYNGTGSVSATNWKVDDLQFVYSTSAVAITLYWDENGNTAGTGGSGFWDTTTTNWNPLSDGTGTVQTFTSANPVVFSGTGGGVTIAAGGVTANGGIKVTAIGYAIGGGTLTLGTNPTIDVESGVTDTAISTSIGGSAGLTKTGAGTLTLSGANSFTGNVTLSAGTLAIAADAALGNPANDVQLAGGTLKTSGVVALDAGRDFSGTGTIDVSGAASLEVPGAASFTALTIAGDGAFTMAGAVRSVGALTFSGPASLFGTSGAVSIGGNLATTQTSGTATIFANLDYGALNGTRTITVADGSAANDLVVSGKIASSGTTGRLHKLGDGLLRLEGDNSGFIGGFRIGTADGAAPANGGTVEVTSNKALGTADLQFNAGTLKLNGSLTGANAFPVSINLSIGGQAAVPVRFTGSGAEFAGGISLFKPTGATFRHQMNIETTTAMIIDGAFSASTGTGISTGLNFVGAGSIFFNGATNTVAEPFFIDGPTVGLNGSFPSVNVNVLAGELSASTTTLNDVTIGDDLGEDATFTASGLGTSAITLNSLSLLSDASFVLLLDSAAQTTDHVIVNTSLSLGNGTASLFLGDSAAVPAVLPFGFKLTLIDAGPGAIVSGFFAGYPEGAVVDLAPNQFSISYLGGPDGKDVVLTVPEPGAGLLSLAGALGACGLRRRRR